MRRFNWSWQQVGCAMLLGTLFGFSSAFAQNVIPRKYAVQVSAQVQEAPPRILLGWPNEGDAASYRVSRRNLDSNWQVLGTLAGSETSYADGNVVVGAKYEYQIVKTTYEPYAGYGYISAGIRLPVIDYRGKIIVIAENALADAMQPELAQLQSDLTGDGWVVVRRNMSTADSPQAVKAVIKDIYNSDPANVRGVFLVGHVPVPYAGDFFPDGHENHQGAWPADSYYADIDGEWTDSTVRTTVAEREANWNVPGDGKFDQSNLPSKAELMVGRVDLSNLTCYANKANARSELDLMRQYLRKDHAFRFGQIAVQKRGLICDNFGDKGADPISNSAWRNFAAFFGANNVTEVAWNGYVPEAIQNSYLWSYGSGGGSYYYSSGVASSDDFALHDLRVVFTMFMGSYFGDWNNESNFLRAALGSGSVLTVSYSGFPHTLYFPMALGEPIGYGIQRTLNNSTNTLYPPWNQGSGQVHISLLGDPTLRMHSVQPPSSLSATSGATVTLAWNPSSGNVAGYHLYRSASSDGPFTRLTAEPVGQGSFTDSPAAGTYTYMVRAVKLEQSGSGTYFNLSQGIFANASSTGDGASPQPPNAPTLHAMTLSNRVNLQWDAVENATNYQIERNTGSGWTQIASVGAAPQSFADTDVTAGMSYFYRMRAVNDAGSSPYSAEVRVATTAPPAPAATIRFVELDSTTRGDWPSRFGTEGYAIASLAPALDAVLPVTAPNWTWSADTTDARALLLSPASTKRIAAAWFGDTLTVSTSFRESHRLAFYFADWDRSGRAETITVIDSVTSAVLDTRELLDFAGGRYLVYDVNGSLEFRIEKKAGPNAVLMGIFAGPAEVAPISNKPLTLELRPSGSSSTLRVTGDSGQKFKVYSSPDLASWTEITNGTLQQPVFEVPLRLDKNEKRLFLRTLNYR